MQIVISSGFTRMLVVVACTLVTWVTVRSADAENWPRFRGENGRGTSDVKGIPVTWDSADYAWTTELPGIGHSAPVIWDDMLFVTAAENEGTLRYLVALDALSGEKEWSRLVGMSTSGKHRKSSWASSTPATDGQLVYVAFADEEDLLLSAYDFSGTLVWRRNLGAFESQHGLGVSPVVYGDLVIMPNDQDGPSSIVALEKRTGETVWSVLRSFREVSYATPIVLEDGGGDPQLICVSGATGISSLDPFTGSVNWTTEQYPLRTVASPVYGDGLVVASCGQGGRFGVLQRAVDVRTGEVQWTRRRFLPYVPTPIVYDNYLFEWNDIGIVNCVELETGEDIAKKRIEGHYSGSPICIDGKLYCFSEEGDMVVVTASPELEVLGRTSLDEPSHSTPAVANGSLYLRTFHKVLCLPAQQ